MKASILLFILLASRLFAGQPNIILILVDDLGYGELGCYGNDFNETPHIDSLAVNGVRYTQAYTAAAVCSPTRASIMTGLYPARTGISTWLPPGNETDKYLDPAPFQTINETLSAAGYHSGMIGKWHLDTHFDTNFGGPEAHGWDEVIGTETEYIAMGDYFAPYQKVATLEGPENEFLTERLFREAGQFVARQADGPFFLYLSLYAVHDKLDAPASLVEKYKAKYDARYGEGAAATKWLPDNWQKKGKPDNPWMAAMLEIIDDGVGQLIAQLQSLDTDRDTYLVLFSDSGGAGGVANNGPFRGAKGSFFEGGFRVPLIIAHVPGRDSTAAPIAPTVSDALVWSTDLYPTFAAWANALLPDRALDGLDISPTLTGAALPDRTLYWHHAELNDAGVKSAVRDGDWKYIETKHGEQWLFKLTDDPAEETNLVETNPGKTAALQTKLSDWRASAGAQLATAP